MACIDALELETLRLGVVRQGVTQRCRGKVFYASEHNGVITLRNESCCFRLKAESVDSVWIVRKHTKEGETLVVEMLDLMGRPDRSLTRGITP